MRSYALYPHQSTLLHFSLPSPTPKPPRRTAAFNRRRSDRSKACLSVARSRWRYKPQMFPFYLTFTPTGSARPHLPRCTRLVVFTNTPPKEALPPPPPTAPLEALWKAPPPGFDLRTLRRQASTLRGEAAAACRDEEQVRRSCLQLAETLSATVRNGRDNAAAAREKLGCLHAALRRLRAERRSHGEAVHAAVSWQDSLEELR